MLSRILRVCVVAALFCARPVHAGVPAPASPRLSADVPAQSLAAALTLFGETTGFSVSWPPGTDDLHSPGARSGLTPQEALEALLRGTGLGFEFLNERTVKIIYTRTLSEARGEPEPPPTPDLPPIQEVTITTTRWDRQVTQLPIDMVVWNYDAMVASGVKGIADIGALTPGVAFDFFSSVGSGVYTDIIIRGVTDRHGSATGIFFDDIPLPAARSNTFGRALPPYFDLERVEVLRGPQGTLLGADTQGGAVRFVPNQPSVRTFSGLAHAEWATTARGNPSYEAGAATGGPLVKGVLGYRFSAWYRSDGGYVDRVDPFTGATVDANSNRVTSESLRGALTYAYTSSLTITPSISYVSTRAHDSPSFFTYLSDPSAGDLNNGSLRAQPFSDTYYVGSIRLIGNVRVGELDSRTSYYHRDGDLVVDDTESVKWGGWGNPLGLAYPVTYSNAVTTYTALRQSVFSQEVRLTSPDSDSRSSWTAGVSYYRTRDSERYRVVAEKIPANNNLPLDAANSTGTVQTQFAGYGQVSHRISEHFTLSTGLRVEHEEYDSAQVVNPIRASASETLVAPKFSLDYETGNRNLFYFLAAKGYAPAGVDAALPTCFENLSAYPTDTVWGYELGAKFGLFGGRAHLDTAVFDARWNNGPGVTTNCLVTHIPGTAVSKGFEVKAMAPLGRLEARLEVSYIDAHYTETVSANGRVIVKNGDALGTPPLVASPWNVLTSLEQTVALGGGVNATIQAEDAFHSHNAGPFYTGIPQPPTFVPNFYAPKLGSDPSINVLNLRATINVRAANLLPALCRCATDNAERLDVWIFLNNALDSQPTLLKRNKGADVSNLFYATTFRPRTLGLAGTWRF